MSKEKIRELLICIVAVLVLALVITTNVFATDEAEDIDDIWGNDMNDIENENISNSSKNNNTNNSNRNNNANKNNNNNANKNNTNNKANNNSKNNSSMPYTGLDNSIVFIIAICGISTVYAYKKIRDYNNI